MKKSCKSENQEHLKTCEDFGMIKNEDSRGLRRFYNGRIVPKFRWKLFEDEYLKRRKIGETWPGRLHNAPRAYAMRLEHGYGCTLMHL